MNGTFNSFSKTLDICIWSVLFASARTKDEMIAFCSLSTWVPVIQRGIHKYLNASTGSLIVEEVPDRGSNTDASKGSQVSEQVQDGGSAKEKHLNYPTGLHHEDQVQDSSSITDQPIYLSPHEGGEGRGSNTEKHSDYYTELQHVDQGHDGCHNTDEYIKYYPCEDQVQEMQEGSSYASKFQFLY